MSEEIKRYKLIARHDFLDEPIPDTTEADDGAYVLFSDLESYVQAKVAEERKRCRVEEVEPLWQACSAVFIAVHNMSQIKARVGIIQAENPLAAVQKAQERLP